MKLWHWPQKGLARAAAILALAVLAGYLVTPLPAQGTAPDTPAGLTGELQDDESVDLGWSDSPNATSYQVSYRHAHASVWENLPSGGASVTVTGSSAEVSDLPYPLNYYFRVSASNTAGTSNWSDELLVTPAPIVGTDGCVVAAPPEHLSDFAKHCAAGGIAIVGSNEVSDFAIKLAWNHIMNMLAAHPDVHERMAQAKVHHVLKAASTPGSKFSYANNTRQAWSDEENLLCYPGEARRLYALYDSFIHEFGHAIHRRGLTPAQFTETEDAYTAAKGAGLWDGTYSNADVGEYFAEAVEFYFSGRTAGVRQNRESLAQHDLRIHTILLKYLPANDWRARCPSSQDAPAPPAMPPSAYQFAGHHRNANLHDPGVGRTGW